MSTPITAAADCSAEENEAGANRVPLSEIPDHPNGQPVSFTLISQLLRGIHYQECIRDIYFGDLALLCADMIEHMVLYMRFRTES